MLLGWEAGQVIPELHDLSPSISTPGVSPTSLSGFLLISPLLSAAILNQPSYLLCGSDHGAIIANTFETSVEYYTEQKQKSREMLQEGICILMWENELVSDVKQK